MDAFYEYAWKGACPGHTTLLRSDLFARPAVVSSTERFTARLMFSISPATETATWERGTMDVCTAFYGHPYAYMVVTDGVLDETTLYRDAQFPMGCNTGAVTNCLAGRMLQQHVEHELFELLKPEIMAGCTALVQQVCPSAIQTRTAKRRYMKE